MHLIEFKIYVIADNGSRVVVIHQIFYFKNDTFVTIISILKDHCSSERPVYSYLSVCRVSTIVNNTLSSNFSLNKVRTNMKLFLFEMFFNEAYFFIHEYRDLGALEKFRFSIFSLNFFFYIKLLMSLICI